MEHHSYDLVVIGAGSAGFAAARTAAELGANVALVDRGPLGGLCILRGCMPSKAFIASSDARHAVCESKHLGITTDVPTTNMRFIQRRKKSLVHEFASYRIEGIHRHALHEGPARFLSETELAVGDDVTLTAKSFIIATGSEASPPFIPGLVETGYLDSDAVLELEEIPASVAVLGGGYTACELGQFLSRMGAATTFFIRSGHLLTSADDDIGDALTGYFREEGMDVITHSKVLRVERRGEKKAIIYAIGNEQHECIVDEIFHALGRRPNVAGLDLARADVAYDENVGVTVDSSLRTSNPRIFAVGDVMGEFLLVHVAIYQGEIAARNALRAANEQADYHLISSHTVFCDPQIGVAGATEKELQRDGVPYVRGFYEFKEHGKAMCLGRTQGFVKILAAAGDGRILGAAVIGPEGSELIHEMIVAINFCATAEQFARIPHLHPTLSEIWTYPAEECAEKISVLRSAAVAHVAG